MLSAEWADGFIWGALYGSVAVAVVQRLARWRDRSNQEE